MLTSMHGSMGKNLINITHNIKYEKMDNKIKHLEFIQLVITRMNVNSFLIKGWTITIVAALFALSAKDGNLVYIFFSFFPPLIFWGLDSYYLRQERLFRHLYNRVRFLKEGEIDYNMNTVDFKNSGNVGRLRVFCSATLSIFYLSLLFIITIILYFISHIKTC